MAGLLAAAEPVSFAQQFSDVSTQVGLIKRATRSWGNPIWGDINNDGFVDLIVPRHYLHGLELPFVYLNSGGNSFIDVRATCGLAADAHADWHGFSFGDYDGDGNLDLYISEGAAQGTLAKSDLLYRGQGDGTFENVSQNAGIETSTNRGRVGLWVDYDNDGRLDLFVKNFQGVNRLYKNNNDGTFTQVANAAGLASAIGGNDDGSTCSFADYDNDGLMDLACGGSGSKEALYHHNTDGTFSDVTRPAGLKPRGPTQSIAWGDYDNDGLLDLYVTRGFPESSAFGNTLYRNNGTGRFTDVTTPAGLVTTANTWAAVWADYDNDGFLDLFVACAGASALGIGNANLLYHNNGNGTFTNRAAEEGVQLQDDQTTSLHCAAAWTDYNNDGFPDLILKDGMGSDANGSVGPTGLHRLFKNNANSNHFIKVNLAGVQSNSRGIGARVTVTYSGGICFRQNNGGGGGEFDSQGSEPLHCGIGTATEATVQVIWPSHVIDTLTAVPANSTLTIVEGSAP